MYATHPMFQREKQKNEKNILARVVCKYWYVQGMRRCLEYAFLSFPLTGSILSGGNDFSKNKNNILQIDFDAKLVISNTKQIPTTFL